MTATTTEYAPDLRKQFTLSRDYDWGKGNLRADPSPQEPPTATAVNGPNNAWKAMTGYADYEASSSGLIRRTSTGRLLKQRGKDQPFATLAGPDGGQRTVYIKTAV